MKEDHRKCQKHILNIENAEKIGFIGDSYTESHFSIEGKAYICKLSLFSDYNYENFAKSGDTYRGNLDRMRKELPIYHDKLSWKDFRPKYAFMVSYTNDLKYMDEEQYLNDLRATIETVKGLGALPIISTEYHSNFGPGLQIGLRQVAKEYDCEYIDILADVERTRGKDYVPFWSGTHPGTRSNHLMGDPFESYLNKLPRPRQSLKVFRLREDFRDIEELIFNTNEERAKLFKEINVGHNALVDVKEVDNVTAAAHAPVTSEYLKLQNGEDVVFNNVALISAVLPSTSLGLESLALDLGDLDAKVYVKDIMKAPYPTPTFYQRFDLEDNYKINVGDVYKSDNPHFENVEFTIKEVSEESVLTLPYPRIATNIPGTLTKVRGEGDEVIPYPYTAIGFSNDYPSGKARVGHYVELEEKDGKYEVPMSLLRNCVDYDKVHFIVVKEGQFAISTLNVEWSGVENKVYRTSEMRVTRAKGKELIKSSVIGTKEGINDWSVNGKVDCYVPTDGCLPKGCPACIDLVEGQAVVQTVAYETAEEAREVQITVLSRYFPDIYDSNMPYEQCAITLNSYDYIDVYVDMIYNGKVFTQKTKVGLHWKEAVLDTILPAHTEEVTLRVYTQDARRLQLCKVSVKEMN